MKKKTVGCTLHEMNKAPHQVELVYLIERIADEKRAD